jgi:DNA-binding transcriptional MerR regulator
VSTPPLGPRAAARATGVSTDTLRHYERFGLLTGVTRSPGGYRRYSDEAIRRVLLIQRALIVGFSLRELAGVLAVRDTGGAPCRKVRALVGARLVALERRIETLIKLRDDMRRIVKMWDQRLRNTAPGQPAHLLDSLARRSTIERVRRARTPRGVKESPPSI